MQASPCDGQWFNSGLLLLSSSLVSPAHLPRPTSTDPLLHGDQGYLNAIRYTPTCTHPHTHTHTSLCLLLLGTSWPSATHDMYGVVRLPTD